VLVTQGQVVTWFFECPRPVTHPTDMFDIALTTEFALDDVSAVGGLNHPVVDGRSGERFGCNLLLHRRLKFTNTNNYARQ
jgi:hypothetical protein